MAAPPAAASARLWVSARRPRIPSLPDPAPGPAAPPPTRHLYLLRERAEGVEAGAASSSAQRGAVGPQPFPAAATALSRAALGWRAAASNRGSGGGARGEGHARQAPGGKTLPLSVRPGKSSLAAASRERAGGRPNGEGSRGVGNGCHVGQVGRRPPPPRRDLWFVPRLRLSSSARPAGPDPATRRPEPAGAPSPAAPSGDGVGPVGSAAALPKA